MCDLARTDRNPVDAGRDALGQVEGHFQVFAS
jgi:hypothetical protein